MDDQIKGAPTGGHSLQAGRSPANPASGGQGNISNESGKSSATAADLKEKVADDVRSATNFAKQEIAGVSDKAKDAADAQKNFFADKMSGMAQAMEKVAEELEQGDNPEIGRMTRTLGSNMRKFSDDIQDRSLGEIAGMAEDFGRKQPLAFLGIAAIAGLAASRFLTASAPHKSSRTGTKPASPALASGPTPIGVTPSASPSPASTTGGRLNG